MQAASRFAHGIDLPYCDPNEPPADRPLRLFRETVTMDCGSQQVRISS